VVSSYFNEAGEPLMSASQARREAEIDAMNAEEDAAGLNDVGEDMRPIGECCVCDEPFERGTRCVECLRPVCCVCWVQSDGRVVCLACHEFLAEQV